MLLCESIDVRVHEALYVIYYAIINTERVFYNYEVFFFFFSAVEIVRFLLCYIVVSEPTVI